MAENNENNNKAGKVQKDIELRSEKVRNIVGKIPPVLLRVGIAIISIIILLVLILAWFIPYPEYKDVAVYLYSDTPVVVEKAPESGLFETVPLRGHIDKGNQTGTLFIGNAVESEDYARRIDWMNMELERGIWNFDVKNIPQRRTRAGVSGYVYYQKKGHTHVEKGDILYTIIPDTISEIYGICRIPGNETGRIREGQEVSLTLKNNYGRIERETVYINGRVHSIYPLAESGSNGEESYYKVEISGFPDSLRTCEDKWFLLPGSNFQGRILLSGQPVLRKILGID